MLQAPPGNFMAYLQDKMHVGISLIPDKDCHLFILHQQPQAPAVSTTRIGNKVHKCMRLCVNSGSLKCTFEFSILCPIPFEIMRGVRNGKK